MLSNKAIHVSLVFIFFTIFTAAQENIIDPTSITEIQENLIDTTTNNTLPSLTLKSINTSIFQNVIENEVPLMVREFQDLMRLYQSPPKDTSARVSLYQRLLTRLNKMTVNTEFLASYRDLMKSSLRFRLGLRKEAYACLENIFSNTQFPTIQDDVIHTLVSFAYFNSEQEQLKSFLNKYQSQMIKERIAYFDLIIRSFSQNVTIEEVKFLVENVILAPVNLYQHEGFKAKLIANIQDKIQTSDLSQTIQTALMREDYSTALLFMTINIKQGNVSLSTLSDWGQQLKSYEKDLISVLRVYQRHSDDYKQYITLYNEDFAAKSRGRMFHRRLYAYRGMPKAPYSVVQAQKILDDYLLGAVEVEYIEKNAQRAFRNFLAYQKYDLLISYTEKMREKLNGEISPYVSFWGSYAMLRQGDTNSAIPLLGEILAEDPESYYGIVAQKKLKSIFALSEFSIGKFVNQFKDQSSTSRRSMIHYAHILYYLGNRNGRNQAERILAKEGLIPSGTSFKLSTTQRTVASAYLQLSMSKNVQQQLYLNGIKTLSDQDVALAELYQQLDCEKGIRDIIAHGGKRLASNKKTYTIGKKALQIYYPQPYLNHLQTAVKKSSYNMDMFLLYSVMRTESFYKEKAKSHAGAMGLMQIMPVTGKWLLSTYLPDQQGVSLYKPEVNIYLGSTYLYDNIERSGMLHALAAYNSGPTFMRNLATKYNPQSDLELVEIHPKQETRNYVKKVIESYQRYTSIYNSQTIDLMWQRS